MIFLDSMFLSSTETQVLSSYSICCYLRGIVVIAVNISCHISLPPQTDTNIIMPM